MLRYSFHVSIHVMFFTCRPTSFALSMAAVNSAPQPAKNSKSQHVPTNSVSPPVTQPTPMTLTSQPSAHKDSAVNKKQSSANNRDSNTSQARKRPSESVIKVSIEICCNLVNSYWSRLHFVQSAV